MKSTRSEEDFPLNSESDVSGASFSDDDDISEASDDHMSTISMIIQISAEIFRIRIAAGGG